jgi:DNA-binding protein HU-beta
MTKRELIDQMAADAAISKKAAADALDSLMTAIGRNLKKKNGKICLTGFGTFYKHRQKARKGYNPHTGQSIKIKARNLVKFRPGVKLRAIR